MKLIRLGMIGFGNVAHGFIQALIERCVSHNIDSVYRNIIRRHLMVFCI